MANRTTYNNITVAPSTNVSYIEAGSKTLPTLLLLHGFPSSSNQWRNLIPLLSATYHIIAPDLPGFGLTTVPADYNYTFENLTNTISAFLTALQLSSYAVYIFDYGAPIGLRLALQKPESIKAIFTQNGNAYVEGLGHPFWTPVEALWQNNSAANQAVIRDNVLTLAGTEMQYVTGVPKQDLPLVNPAAYIFDFIENEEGKRKQDIQLSLLYDYRTNVELYPTFQKYFRDTQVPLMAVWGKGDPAFIPPGAEAFKRDLPNATVEFLDGGHFLLETKVEEVAEKLLGFLKGIKF